MSTLLSPLARKLCTARGISPETLVGSGPRGRIMAADVPATPPAAPPRRGGTAKNDPVLLPTRPAKDSYYIYDDEVNMKALADISLPIAVQCEKLLERRYTLFDYIVRAVVKACCTLPDWVESCGKVNVLLFERAGRRLATISDTANKSLYRLVRETKQVDTLPADFSPHIIICDTRTSREQVSARLSADMHPAFAFIARGGLSKEAFHVCSQAPHYDLPYTFYAADTIPAAEANRVAARLHTLLIDPVSLLLL